MRLKPPQRSGGGECGWAGPVGPRFLPGTYTVKLTKDKDVYTTPLHVVADPRAKHTADDRQAQFELR